MSKHEHLAPLPPPNRQRRTWTRAEDYLPGRRRSRFTPRTDLPPGAEPASRSRPLLGIVPFMLLMAVLAVMVVAIMIAAYPGQVHPAASPSAAPEPGTAQPGWLKG